MIKKRQISIKNQVEVKNITSTPWFLSLLTHNYPKMSHDKDKERKIEKMSRRNRETYYERTQPFSGDNFQQDKKEEYLAVNFHITNACNYKCHFCFAKYEKDRIALSKKDSFQLLKLLRVFGFKKINFAGGEPTLVKYLPDLIVHAKKLGFYVSLISNGTNIDENFLKECGKYIDLIGLSIDSQYEHIEKCLGRTKKDEKNHFSHVDLIKQRAKIIHNANIKLKINTTITAYNWKEDMHDLINELKPFRWKVFQVLHIEKVNDSFFYNKSANSEVKSGRVTDEQFKYFIKRHKNLNPVYETSEIMSDSYLMITPDGRFYYNKNNHYNYSNPILKVGVEKALENVNYDSTHFLKRKGNFFKVIK